MIRMRMLVAVFAAAAAPLLLFGRQRSTYDGIIRQFDGMFTLAGLYPAYA
jgi:hypothetical protein